MTDVTGTPTLGADFFEDSRLMAIAINATNTNLIWRAQTKPNGPWETDWAWVNNTNKYDVMVGGLAQDQRVVILAQTMPTPTVHFYIEKSGGGGGMDHWEAPVDLGLPPGVPGFSQLVTAPGALDGKVQVFGLAKDTGYVWWIYQNPDGNGPPWSSWQQLTARRLEVMTAANNGDRTITVAGSAFDNATFHIFYTRQKTATAKTPADWTPWVDMTQGHIDASFPALRLDQFGSLNLFAIGAGTEVIQTRQLPANSDTFTPWANPFQVGTPVTQIAAGLDGDGHLVLVAQDQNKVIHVNTLSDAAKQQWSGWQQIATTFQNGPMTLDYNADGRLTLFLREAAGPQRLLCKSQIANNSSSWEASWTVLSISALARYGIVRDLTP